MDEPYPSAMHIDLKRDLYAHAKGKNSTSNLDSKLPLFEKYQFLSSGRSIIRPLLTLLTHGSRNFHGRYSSTAPTYDSICWYQCDFRPRSIIHGFQQGDGSGCAEEATAMMRSCVGTAEFSVQSQGNHLNVYHPRTLYALYPKQRISGLTYSLADMHGPAVHLPYPSTHVRCTATHDAGIVGASATHDSGLGIPPTTYAQICSRAQLMFDDVSGAL